MGIETFPEIENFQKLPRQVIVKGGDSSFDKKTGARLSGIVINNIGNTIQGLRVSVVIFDAKGIPVLNISTVADPESIPQGGISSFTFQFEDHSEEIKDYYLYPSWRFDDRE